MTAPLLIISDSDAFLTAEMCTCVQMLKRQTNPRGDMFKKLLVDSSLVMKELPVAAGIAKKQAERQQKAKDEAVAAGMLPAKGSGKTKNRSNVDKGLVEDGGLFKAGMLRVKSTALGKSTSSKRKGPLSQRRAFSSGKIGNLDGNSQKAWNVASSHQVKKKGPVKKGRK